MVLSLCYPASGLSFNKAAKRAYSTATYSSRSTWESHIALTLSTIVPSLDDCALAQGMVNQGLSNGVARTPGYIIERHMYMAVSMRSILGSILDF